MNYIVLDMEWNQPYPGAKKYYRNGHGLDNEIIQIGAVKLDREKQITDSFKIYVKPQVIKRLHHHVEKLTGIDEKMLADADSLEKAVEHFREWCGTDYVFLTWGYDDIGVLGNNLAYFGLPTDWLPPFYNLQMIFCAQTENLNKQYSLTYAAEYFHIALDKPLHDALTDAYYTALVAAALDLDKGIDSYRAMVFKDETIPEHMKNIRYKKNYTPVEGYHALLEKTQIASPVCCECGRPLENPDRAQNGKFSFLTIGTCPEHGEFAKALSVSAGNDDRFGATEMFYALDRYNKPFFLKKLKKMRHANRRRQGKPKNTQSQTARSRQTAHA